jgi:ribosomal protein S18 acetylase RimI-like enzyme
MPPPITTPYGTAEPVEGPEVVAVPVVGPPGSPVDAAFADGIQRYVVEGWFGLAPVVRAYVASAVLERTDRTLVPVRHRTEEFLVAPLEHLPPRVVDSLKQFPMPVYDCRGVERPHPLLDVQRAVGIVEQRRRAAEAEVVEGYRRESRVACLVVDGSLRGLGAGEAVGPTLLGVIKSHETQFLRGADLETALTLREGHRTTVFCRLVEGGAPMYSWYLRLWDWNGRDILYGLIRLERLPSGEVVRDVDRTSRWLLAERAPLSAPDARWDRLLYPIHAVEEFLKAKAGGWR